MMKPNEFVRAFGNKEEDKLIRFAKIDPNYTSGRPSLIFDGEMTVSVKKYPYLSSYIPSPNERVIMIKGVIIGKIV
jgi:hypothetical protein